MVPNPSAFWVQDHWRMANLLRKKKSHCLTCFSQSVVQVPKIVAESF